MASGILGCDDEEVGDAVPDSEDRTAVSDPLEFGAGLKIVAHWVP